MLLCHHCVCVHFRRALESQAKRCLHIAILAQENCSGSSVPLRIACESSAVFLDPCVSEKIEKSRGPILSFVGHCASEKVAKAQCLFLHWWLHPSTEE